MKRKGTTTGANDAGECLHGLTPTSCVTCLTYTDSREYAAMQRVEASGGQDYDAIRARYEGWCNRCRGSIIAGNDMIVPDPFGEGWIHADH